MKAVGTRSEPPSLLSTFEIGFLQRSHIMPAVGIYSDSMQADMPYLKSNPFQIWIGSFPLDSKYP